MPTMRKRSRSASSLKKRLLKFAEEVRAAAKFIAPGPEQDQLLRKALKAETLANTVVGRRWWTISRPIGSGVGGSSMAFLIELSIASADILASSQKVVARYARQSNSDNLARPRLD